MREAPLVFLRELVLRGTTLAHSWRDVGATAFAGEVAIGTDNSDYRFVNGVFASRAKKPLRAVDVPAGMQGLLLVGFLVEDDANDRWSLLTTWQPGSHAVFYRPGPLDARSFVLTSPTRSFAHATAEPEPSPWAVPRVPASGIVRLQRPVARPPLLRVPEPPSMTRLHPAAAGSSSRL